MTLSQALQRIHEIVVVHPSLPVLETCALELQKQAGNVQVRYSEKGGAREEKGRFLLSVDPSMHQGPGKTAPRKRFLSEEQIVSFCLREDGSGHLVASHGHIIFACLRFILENLLFTDAEFYRKGKEFRPAFGWQRVSYDFFLNQEGRIQKGLNRETYIRELARLGMTHAEVNGLAWPMSLETGPAGETYPMFYTYCPALDQFVSSGLNRGLYPSYYLSANLARLKDNAGLALRYGLKPVLLCFEPRSVPERFFEKYPMLRGARVDHPFRSFKPRYTMTLAHPAVLEHYAEMLGALMTQVPELSALCIWSNDSGSGFEHTKSLYVGRNGGAYLIREWRDDEAVAHAAGENILRFFRVLRQAARRINPEFRILARLESFYGEHDTVWEGLEDGIDAETATLTAKGWEMPYSHPLYPENHAINAGTVYQDGFDQKEKIKMDELASRGSFAHFYFACGPWAMFAPLLGIPYPFLTHKRLSLLLKSGVSRLAHFGGVFPPELVPFPVNQEVVRYFTFDPARDIEDIVQDIACRWAGESLAPALIGAWKTAEQAILAFPIITPMYCTYGFSWYRLWVRPLVPDYEAIPLEERSYYESFMCTTPHNPNNVDLARDVLFQLVEPAKCEKDMVLMDKSVLPVMRKAIQILDSARQRAGLTQDRSHVITDQALRLRALSCWFRTQRNVAAWIAGVHGILEKGKSGSRQKHLDRVREAIADEIENTSDLLDLLGCGVPFMSVTDQGESPLMHGENLAQLLRLRLSLMKKHLGDEPWIDPEYMLKKAGHPVP